MWRPPLALRLVSRTRPAAVTPRVRIPLVGELRTNKDIETAAIAWVISKEEAEGRFPKDVRFTGASYDVDSPPRAIEVKAFGGSNRGFGLWLEVSQIDEARRNPNFYVYVVENVRQGIQRTSP